MLVSSPHAWGCFLYFYQIPWLRKVFPTRVGVFLSALCAAAYVGGLPHTRGGVSASNAITGLLTGSSPHAWGCFRVEAHLVAEPVVFPTRVGVFPSSAPCSSGDHRLPHTRGGVSPVVVVLGNVLESSPHAWGCFYRAESQPDGIIVFPTRVGVFLVHGEDSTVAPCLPHTRGGVSTSRRPRQGDHVSSPTRVGVFPCSWPSS